MALEAASSGVCDAIATYLLMLSRGQLGRMTLAQWVACEAPLFAQVELEAPQAAAQVKALKEATINLEMHRARAEVQDPFGVCSTPEEEEQMRKGARSIADLPRGSEKREAQRQLVFARLPVEWQPSIYQLVASMTGAYDVCSTPEEEEQMRKGARSIADLPRGSEKREAQRQLVFARLPVEWRPKIDKLVGNMTPGAHTCARCRVCGYEFTLVKDKLDKARKVVRQHTVLGGGIGCPGSRQSPAGVGPGS